VGDLVAELLRLPPSAVYGVIGALAAVENVFPPVPADTAVALGAFLSAGGTISAGVIFLVTWVANVCSAAAVYTAARVVGRPFFRGRTGARLLRPAALVRIEQLYARHGVWAIFLSRFVPGVRAVVPPFAGVAGLGVVRAVVPVALASGLWYGALTAVAAFTIRNASQIGALIAGANRVALAGAGVLLVIVAAVLLVRRHRSEPRS
jgi:membrane protein DedA with SNARE-associated domain